MIRNAQIALANVGFMPPFSFSFRKFFQFDYPEYGFSSGGTGCSENSLTASS